MLRECSVLEKEISDTLQSLYPLLETLTTLAGNQPELREYADIAFTCREVEAKIDDFLKRLRQVSYIAEAEAVKGMERLGISKIVSHSCTATSKPRMWYKLPYKREQNPETWDRIMEAIGVSELAAKLDLVRFHAPSLMDYCTTLIGMGKQPPDGINPKECTAAELRLSMRRK